MKSLGNLTKNLMANLNSCQAARALGSVGNGITSFGSNYSPEHQDGRNLVDDLIEAHCTR